MSLPSTIIIGYGNPDRQDDGVAWHILAQLSRDLKIEKPDPEADDFFPSGGNPDLLSTLQLTPEMAETISTYERVCFIDAHTGQIPGEISCHNISPEFITSPLTHHLTPQTLLSLVATLYQKYPASILVSVRGYDFGFSRSLSEKTSQLVPRAVQVILGWYHVFNEKI